MTKMHKYAYKPAVPNAKPYCECGKDANMGSNDTEYKCFTCCKPNYATWWANRMNEKEEKISDTAMSYQQGYIAGIARGKQKMVFAIEKLIEKEKYELISADDTVGNPIISKQTVNEKLDKILSSLILSSL